MFFTLFVIGAVGFGVMLVMSFGHFAGGHHTLQGPHHSAAIGHHAHGTVTALQRIPGGKVIAASRASGNQSLASRIPWQFLFISPMDIFAFCLGCGGAGMLLAHLVPATWLIWVAVLAGMVYNYGIIRPVIGFFLRFASKESLGLEGLVATTGEALGHFDNQGRGIVRLTLDGQYVQLLARLDETEHQRGVTVARGDTLMILEVDAKRNTCRVSRDLAA